MIAKAFFHSYFSYSIMYIIVSTFCVEPPLRSPKQRELILSKKLKFILFNVQQ